MNNRCNRPTEMMCSVVGMGFLGTRIAGELSRCGLRVKVYDAYPQQIEKSMAMLQKDSLELVQRRLKPLDRRIIGCRFLVPVYSIPLVEISLSTFTSEEVRQKVERFFDQLGFSTIYKRHGLFPRKLTPDEINRFWEDERSKLCDSTKRNRVMQESRDDAHKLYENGLAVVEENWGLGNLSQSSSNQSRNGCGGHCISSGNLPTENDYISFNESTTPGAVAPDVVQNLASQHNSETRAGHVTMIDRRTQQGSGKTCSSCRECIVCQDRYIDTIILPCSHMWLCYDCALSLQRDGKSCPACRGNIENVVKAYAP